MRKKDKRNKEKENLEWKRREQNKWLEFLNKNENKNKICDNSLKLDANFHTFRYRKKYFIVNEVVKWWVLCEATKEEWDRYVKIYSACGVSSKAKVLKSEKWSLKIFVFIFRRKIDIFYSFWSEF